MQSTESISEDIRNEIKATLQTHGGTELHRQDVEKIFLLFRSLSSDGYPLLDVMVAITAAVRLVVEKKTVNPKKLSLLLQRNSLTSEEIGLECEDFELLKEMILRDFPPAAAAASSSSSSATIMDVPVTMSAAGAGAAASSSSSSSTLLSLSSMRVELGVKPGNPRRIRKTQGDNTSSRTSPTRSRSSVGMSLPYRSSSSVGASAGASADGGDYRKNGGGRNSNSGGGASGNGDDSSSDGDGDGDGGHLCDICNDFVAVRASGLTSHRRSCILKNGGGGSSSSGSGGGGGSSSKRNSSSSSSSNRGHPFVPYDNAPFPLRLLPGSKNCEIGLDPDNPFQCDNNSKDYGKHITLPFCTVGCPDYVVTSGKWYYEVELCVYASDETEQAYDRDISVGWATPLFQVPSDQRKTKSFGIGDDEEGQSWAYDLLHLNACHGGEEDPLWKKGFHMEDINTIGCALDIEKGTIDYYRYAPTDMGRPRPSQNKLGTAFLNLQEEFEGGVYPCISMRQTVCEWNFGHSLNDLKMLPKGYRPFCEYLAECGYDLNDKAGRSINSLVSRNQNYPRAHAHASKKTMEDQWKYSTRKFSKEQKLQFVPKHDLPRNLKDCRILYLCKSTNEVAEGSRCSSADLGWLEGSVAYEAKCAKDLGVGANWIVNYRFPTELERDSNVFQHNPKKSKREQWPLFLDPRLYIESEESMRGKGASCQDTRSWAIFKAGGGSSGSGKKRKVKKESLRWDVGFGKKRKYARKNNDDDGGDGAAAASSSSSSSHDVRYRSLGARAEEEEEEQGEEEEEQGEEEEEQGEEEEDQGGGGEGEGEGEGEGNAHDEEENDEREGDGDTQSNVIQSQQPQPQPQQPQQQEQVDVKEENNL